MTAEQREQEKADREVRAGNENIIRIPGDKVQEALNRLLAAGEIDEGGKSEIWWLYNYEQTNNWNLEDVGKAIRKDSTTAYRMFLGRYGARYDNLVEDVRSYHKLAVERGGRRKLAFVETDAWRKIDPVCRHALVGQLPAFIYGASQIGKTTCLEEFARRNNHGTTKMIRMCAAPSLAMVMQQIAEACYIPRKLNVHEMRRRIFASIDDKMLVIFDELHQVLIGCGDSAAIRIIEFLREVYDRTHCGMVFSGTKVLRDEIENGRLNLMLDQFRRRGIINLVLPDTPSKADVNRVAKAFGLEAPEGTPAEIIKDMLKRSGLGQYFSFMQSASNLAANQKKPLSWDHFVIAYDTIQQLSTVKE